MESRNCQNCKNQFSIDSDDFSFYEKMKLPSPTFCPPCRFQRRATWRNDLSLYNRKCNLCQKDIISIYSVDTRIITYCNKCWHSDLWNPYEYGIEYDFSKSFFEQFNNLMLRVPHMGLVNDNNISSIGCEYTGDCWFAKNCYMTFCAWKIENVMYSYCMLAGKDMVDCLYVKEGSDWMYECIHCDKCYNIKYSELCLSCTDSSFLYDCRNCSNCFMSYGLRNKSYFYKNKQYSKEEYEKIISSYNLDTFSGIEKAKEEFSLFIIKSIRRYSQVYKSINCTGDFLVNGKMSRDCYIGVGLENSRYIQHGGKNIDSYDLTTTGEQSECYEGIVLDHSNKNFFGIYSVKSQNIEYTMHCSTSKYLFGCVGIKNGEYSILNRRYSKEEYFELIEKIKKQMNEVPYIDKNGCVYKYGEFFPSELSYFGYNETCANEFFPLEEKDAVTKNFKWQNQLQKTIGKETIETNNIPDSINDISNTFLNQTLSCFDCKRNYKITESEFCFYKKMLIPIPRRCFYCRHQNRLEKRLPFKLWERTCMCTSKDHFHQNQNCDIQFQTSYNPDRSEIIYCEKCYQQEIN